MNSSTNKLCGLTANTLKWIAIVCMVIDHITSRFIPEPAWLYVLLRFIGRTTAPIMCYLIAEGYFHTRNVWRYAIRLAFWTFVSWLVFSISNGTITYYLGMLWTLLLGLAALWSLDHLKYPVVKALAVCGCILLSRYGDWQYFGVLFILAFGQNRGNFQKQAIWFSLTAIGMILLYTLQRGGQIPWMQFGVFLSLPLLYRYNGQRGGQPWMKWFFYPFYPLHLLILNLIRNALQ